MATRHDGVSPRDDIGSLPQMKSELLELNMGPQHPSTHGVLRLLIHTDGEIVHSVRPYIGYLHRCAEKTAEGCDYRQWIVYTDRFDYLAPMNGNFGYVVAVEKLLGITIPERADYIRSSAPSCSASPATSSPSAPSGSTWGPGRPCCTPSASAR